ncbi:MAG TPA: histidine--tRNA ligase, partial [Armatimonadota bacterium]|nr:histidine--tRNA ligase [Armatimonadota bacterium]
ARKEVLRIVTGTFESFGFGPLETPAIEYATTLQGKYGPDAERLIYKFDSERGPNKELALRYDFTVPLARVVAMNPELQMGLFRRYQVGPIWRRDRPQKNRYREFVQCDVDIIGVDSVTADAEIVAVLCTCLANLGFDGARARLNDRKILNGLAEAVGSGDDSTEMMRSLDKLDKIGEDGVREDLSEKGFSSNQCDTIFALGGIEGTSDQRLTEAVGILSDSSVGMEGIAELRTIMDCLVAMDVPEERVIIDFSLARGLEIYTGPVYEVEVPGLSSPSIAGGGRYDGLIGIFLNRDIPATGASFGLDRVANAMEELGILPKPQGECQVLVTVFDESTRPASLKAATALRKAGVNAEVYLGSGKLRSQFGYADRRGIPIATVIGPDEQAEGVVGVRDLATRQQEKVAVADMVAQVQSIIAGAAPE